jgi:hypothetical protein
MKSINKLLFLIIIFLYNENVFAQQGQTFFEDSKGESSIIFPNGGLVRLNFADSDVKFGYIFSNTVEHFFWGLDLSGKASNSIASIFSKGDISPGAKANLNLGFKELLGGATGNDAWVNFRLGYRGVSYTLFDPAKAYDEQISKDFFSGYDLTGNFNFKLSQIGSYTGIGGLLGLGIGYNKINNLNNLDEFTITSQVNLTNGTPSAIRSYKEEINARIGQYSEYNAVPIRADFFWYPKFKAQEDGSIKDTRLGFHHYFRSQIANNKTFSSLGTGVYYLKKKNPLQAIAGIALEVKDLSNIGNKSDFKDNAILNFIIGHSFQ